MAKWLERLTAAALDSAFRGDLNAAMAAIMELLGAVVTAANGTITGSQG